MSKLRFDEFEFDTGTRELRRRGRMVPIQDLPLRALEILLENPRHVIPRQVFFDRLWPDDHSGLLDDNLNTTLRKLRQALRDTPSDHRFIVTVPKRGYRFIATVEKIEGEGEPFAAGKPAERAGAKSITPWVAALVLVVAVVVLGLWFSSPDDTVSPSQPEVRVAADTVSDPTIEVDENVRTLAVLPFTNASGNPDDEYFSSGLTDEIIYRLGREPGIRVVSRSSASSVDTNSLGAKAIGNLLNADILVEGNVRRSEDRLRVGIQLVDAKQGLVLWTEHFDRDQRDIFSVQEDIANTIATTLAGASSMAQRDANQHRLSAADPEAYDNYLQGRFHWHRRTREGLGQAVGFFELSTQKAPGYAPAWAGLADALAVLGFYDYLPPREAFPAARAAARKALDIDPANVSAHATLGYVALYFDWDLAAAEQHFLDAIALQPGDSKAHQWYANLLTADGRFDEAEREMRTAQQLDPLSVIANAALGWVQYFAGRHPQAMHQFALTLELAPRFELAYMWRGWTLEATGDMPGAVAALQSALDLSSGGGIANASLARAEALSGNTEAARARLNAMVEGDGYVPAYEMAKAWFAVGDRIQAIEWLNRAFDERSHSMVFIRVDPQLASETADPAVAAIADRVFARR